MEPRSSPGKPLATVPESRSLGIGTGPEASGLMNTDEGLGRFEISDLRFEMESKAKPRTGPEGSGSGPRGEGQGPEVSGVGAEIQRHNRDSEGCRTRRTSAGASSFLRGWTRHG